MCTSGPTRSSRSMRSAGSSGSSRSGRRTKGHGEAVAVGPAAVPHGERVWGIEDCRHLSARLERDLLTGGERVVRVPPKLMAQAPGERPDPGQVRSDRCAGGGAGGAARTGAAGRGPR